MPHPLTLYWMRLRKVRKLVQNKGRKPCYKRWKTFLLRMKRLTQLADQTRWYVPAANKSRQCAFRAHCCAVEQSFNIVLNAWAQSKSRDGAKRAMSILKHMERRFATNNTDIHPDATSYSTVINAWSRSRDEKSVQKAEEVLQWAEEANAKGHFDLKLNTLTYNSMINCYAKSNESNAAERALEILERLKYWCFEKGNLSYQPDVVTYTSVIDALAKQGTLTASKKAEALLDELETAFAQSNDTRLKPNIRTYTSVSQSGNHALLFRGRLTN